MTTAKRGGHLVVTIEHSPGAQSATSTLGEGARAGAQQRFRGEGGHISGASEAGWVGVGSGMMKPQNMITLDTDDDSS